MLYILPQIIREIELHKNLSHTNVVAFHSFFEDDDYVYIILEVCTRKVRAFGTSW